MLATFIVTAKKQLDYFFPDMACTCGLLVRRPHTVVVTWTFADCWIQTSLQASCSSCRPASSVNALMG